MAEITNDMLAHAIASAWGRKNNRGKEFDSDIVEAAADAVMVLLASLSVQPEPYALDENKFGPAVLVEGCAPVIHDIGAKEARRDAYGLAIDALAKSVLPRPTDLHETAALIAHNIENAFPPKANEAAAKAQAEKDALEERQAVLRQALAAVQQARETVARAKASLVSGRIAQREAGWNDCKTVMRGVINAQLRRPTETSMLCGLSHGDLLQIKEFVGSFHFDPAKP